MKPSPEEQMRSNARCWLAAAGFPPLAILDNPPATQDQCFIACHLGAVGWAGLVMDRWNFECDSADHRPLGYRTAVAGWRERGKAENLQYRWGAHLIHHKDYIGNREFFSLDFDSHSANQGLYYAIAHGLVDCWWQKLFRRKTSPFKVARARHWDIVE